MIFDADIKCKKNPGYKTGIFYYAYVSTLAPRGPSGTGGA